MATITTSAIIVSWNVSAHLKRCLEALSRERGEAMAEVFVVDNASSDASVEMVRTQYPWVKLIVLPENRGFAAACNLAAKQASGSHLLLLNPDTEVVPGFAAALASFWEIHPQAGVVGGHLTNDDGTLQPSVRGLPTLWSSVLDSLKLLGRAPWLAPGYLKRDFDYTKTQPVEQVMGACFSVPRALWQELSGFDEGYWIWFEEADFCARLLKLGYQVWYEPRLELKHTQAASFNQLGYLAKHRRFTKSLLRYLRLHHSWLGVALVWLAARPWFAVAPVLDVLRPKTRPRQLTSLQTTLATVLSLASLELVSWWGWHVPLVGSIAALSIAVTWLVVAYRNVSLGVVLLVLELIVGSFGGLVSLKLPGLTLSLRQLLFLSAFSLTTWRLVTGPGFMFWKQRGLKLAYLGALAVLAWGSAVALYLGRQPADFFLDLQRYLYLLLVPLFFEAALEANALRYAQRLLSVGLGWLWFKTTVTLYLFSHLNSEQLLRYYQWFRQTGFGEITYVSGNFFRVFSQSQVFAALATAMGFAWLWYALHTTSSWRQRLACHLWLGLSLSLVLMSFSRSFWLGTLVAWLGVLIPSLIKRSAGFLVYLKYIAYSVITLLAAVGFMLAVVQLSWPLVPLNATNASLFADRLRNGEPASNSRLALLPPLGQAVLQHPVVGSGFGATVTFHSLDPRLVQTTAGGSGLTTTYAFEWGYLDLWLKLGLLGLLGYLGFVGYGLGPSIRAWWQGNLLGASLSLAALALLTLNMTTPYLNHPLGLGAIMALITLGWVTHSRTSV